MPKKLISLAEVGEVTISKSRRNRNIRLSISPRGAIRVSMPPWIPFEIGVKFVQKNRDWIIKQLSQSKVELLEHGSKIGKAHHLYFTSVSELGETIKTNLTATEVSVSSGLSIDDSRVQVMLADLCEQALKLEAQHLLPLRISKLADRHGYQLKSVKVKKLTSRWGSCSSDGNIVLNYYLIQLPWALIDYVLVHELTHTVHRHHQTDFWQALEATLPGTKRLRKELRLWRPQLMPAKR